MFGLGPDQYRWLGLAEDTVYWCTVAMSPEPEHCQYCHQPPQSGSDAQAAGTRGSHETVTRHMSRCHETCDIVTQ